MQCSDPKIKRCIVTVFFVWCLVMLLTSCTEYERQGINSRPFNEPADWEVNPYGNAFRN